MMKGVLFLLLMIQSFVFFGQQGGGEEPPKPEKFISSDRVGIIYFETEEVCEAIKIKEDSDEFYDVAKALRKYNRKIKEVAFLNSGKFKELDEKINKLLQRDNSIPVEPEAQDKERKEFEGLKNVIPEARKKVVDSQKELNDELKGSLKEKQFKKWLKYLKKKRKSLIPERPNTNSNSGNGKMSRSGFGTGPNISQQRGGGYYR